MVSRNLVVTSGTTTQVKKVVVGKPVRRVTEGQFTIGNLGGIDLTALSNGSLLVYNSSSTKWVATRDLDNQNVDGGSF